MARPREFDRNRVLSGVMHAFRKRGYANTSVRDLEEAGGVTSGSLYNSFSDKMGIFRAAGIHYLDTVIEKRLEKFSPKEAGYPGLRDLFLSLLDEPQDQSYGCLLTNSAIEFGDSDCGCIVADGFAKLKAGFAKCLGDREADLDALLAFYQGILVLLRAGYQRQALERMIIGYFDSLTSEIRKEN